MKDSKVIPEPWRSMAPEELQAKGHAGAREMLGAVELPAIVKFREDVKWMTTSELVTLLAHPHTLMEKVTEELGGEEKLSEFDRGDTVVIMSAAILAVGTALDERVPCPARTT